MTAITRFRRWLGRGIAGLEFRCMGDPAAGECEHSWSNWSDPQTISVEVYSPSWIGSDKTTRDGLFQGRRCLKCNIYERRLT